MSCWTHVAAIFRVDSIYNVISKIDPNFENIEDKFPVIFGKTLYTYFDVVDDLRNMGLDPYDEDTKEFKELYSKCESSMKGYEENPSDYLPTGSEGSLVMSVWKNPNSSCAAAYTVSVFGDLRDYGYEEADKDTIKEWFSRCCKSCSVRQATCSIVISGIESYNLSWNYWTNEVVETCI